MLPNLFIVGAPKAGTTSLYYYLKQHEDINMSEIKEPNFFSNEFIKVQNLYYDTKGIENEIEYQKLFDSKYKIRGEASVSYLYYEKVPQKIFNKIPNAKIIILLRKPSDRSLSHYYMDYKLKYVSDTLYDIFNNKSNSVNSHLHYQQYISLSMYYEQVKRYLTVFGEENVRIYTTDEFKNNTQGIMDDIFLFLGLNSKSISIKTKYNSYELPKNNFIRNIYAIGKLRRTLKKILPSSIVDSVKSILFDSKNKESNNALIKELNYFFKPDIIALEKLINKDLKHWYE